MTRIRLTISFLAVLLYAACIPAHAQASYRLTPLIPEPTTATFVFTGGLNDRGQVVGTAFTVGVPHAFAWRDGVATSLEPLIDPGSERTDAVANNNHSDVVGNYLDSQLGIFTGYLLRRGEVMERIEGLPGADATFLEDINNRRQIVGNSSFNAEGLVFGFLWERGSAMLLPPLLGDTTSSVTKINDRGVAIGVSVGDLATSRAVMWVEGRVVDLGLPDSGAADINNRGQIVGILRSENEDHAYLWERGNVTLLPPLSEDAWFVSPASINNHGEVVGRTFYLGTTVPTLWHEGAAIDLNDLVSVDDPLQPFVKLESADRINDRGEIVASGRDSRVPNRILMYFLTPVR